jgi:phenylacetic acid degradation protein
MVIPPRSLVLGAPARVMRPVTDDEIAWKSYGTRQYHDLNVRSMRTMREVEAFTEVEAGRGRLVFDEPHKPKK